jgi:hypothetical protein
VLTSSECERQPTATSSTCVITTTSKCRAMLAHKDCTTPLRRRLAAHRGLYAGPRGTAQGCTAGEPRTLAELRIRSGLRPAQALLPGPGQAGDRGRGALWSASPARPAGSWRLARPGPGAAFRPARRAGQAPEPAEAGARLGGRCRPESRWPGRWWPR